MNQLSKRATAVLVSLLAMAATTFDARADLPQTVVDEVSSIRSAAGLHSKEVSLGCTTTPLPTTPAGNTYSAVVDDNFFGLSVAKFRMIAWRKQCSSSDSQLLLTLAPTAGPTEVPSLFNVSQEGRSYNVMLTRSEAGTSFPATISAPTTAILKFVGSASQTFDDDGALRIRYIGLSAGGSAAIDVPAVSITAPTQPPAAVSLSDALDGAWFDSRTPGQGLLVDIDRTNRIVAGGWYTANAAGVREWMTFLGAIEGDQATLDVFRTDGVRFNQATTVSNVRIGSARIKFTGCTSAQFAFDVAGFGTAELALTKLTKSDDACLRSP